jgi:hypothetical protein
LVAQARILAGSNFDSERLAEVLDQVYSGGQIAAVVAR